MGANASVSPPGIICSCHDGPPLLATSPPQPGHGHRQAPVDSLLALDGFLDFDNRNLIFQVVSRRYEKKKPRIGHYSRFRRMAHRFSRCHLRHSTRRVGHHADAVKIDGESYRLRELSLDFASAG